MPVLNGSGVTRLNILHRNYKNCCYEEIAIIRHSVVPCPHTPGTKHQPYRDYKETILLNLRIEEFACYGEKEQNKSASYAEWDIFVLL